jgi:hypothetical protein
VCQYNVSAQSGYNEIVKDVSRMLKVAYCVLRLEKESKKLKEALAL